MRQHPKLRRYLGQPSRQLRVVIDVVIQIALVSTGS